MVAVFPGKPGVRDTEEGPRHFVELMGPGPSDSPSTERRPDTSGSSCLSPEFGSRGPGFVLIHTPGVPGHRGTSPLASQRPSTRQDLSHRTTRPRPCLRGQRCSGAECVDTQVSVRREGGDRVKEKAPKPPKSLITGQEVCPGSALRGPRGPRTPYFPRERGLGPTCRTEKVNDRHTETRSGCWRDTEPKKQILN